MNGYFVNGSKKVAIPAKLLAALLVLFEPSTAKANVSGKERDKYAAVVKAALPQVAKVAGGKFDSIVIEAEVTRGTGDAAKVYPAVIAIDASNLPEVLDGIIAANTELQKARAKAEQAEVIYKQARTMTINGYEAGKRGRHANGEIDLGLA